MEFNGFVWNIYKESSEFKKLTEVYGDLLKKNLFSEDCRWLFSRFNEYNNLEDERLNQIIAWADLFQIYYSGFDWNEAKSKELIEQLLEEGMNVVYEDGSQKTFFKKENIRKENWIEEIDLISYCLFLSNQELFFPYYFRREFYRLNTISASFNIPLPPLPPKSDYIKRFLYYTELCDWFFSFEEKYNFTNEELFCFIYGFAWGLSDAELSDELPRPHKVWIQGASRDDFNYLENEYREDNIEHWGGNEEALRGDIIVMYCLYPVSSIHSIWRAHTNGFIDPFFEYYRCIYLRDMQKVPLISLNEIKADKVLSQNSLVRQNMQGVNGKSFSVKEYNAICNILEQKQYDILNLPVIEISDSIETFNLRNERDVEVKLIEPLLERLDYKTHDWIRQLPLRMGRGERNYPDYVIFPVTRKGEERGKVLIESKYMVNRDKELYDAFLQVRSYALRLLACSMSVASINGIWVWENKNNEVRYNTFSFYSWENLKDRDTFNLLYDKIGKRVIMSK